MHVDGSLYIYWTWTDTSFVCDLVFYLGALMHLDYVISIDQKYCNFLIYFNALISL